MKIRTTNSSVFKRIMTVISAVMTIIAVLFTLASCGKQIDETVTQSISETTEFVETTIAETTTEATTEQTTAAESTTEQKSTAKTSTTKSAQKSKSATKASSNATKSGNSGAAQSADPNAPKIIGEIEHVYVRCDCGKVFEGEDAWENHINSEEGSNCYGGTKFKMYEPVYG